MENNLIVSGLNTCYTNEDDGNAVLFLHGWGGDRNSFNFIKPQIKGRKICIDLWGFGNSEVPNNFKVKDYADSIKEFLSLLNIKKVNIIAHSFGARIAMYFCFQNPEMVEKVVITGGAGFRNKSLKVKWKKLCFKINKIAVKYRFRDKKALDNYGSKDYKALSPEMKKIFKNVVNEDLSIIIKKIKTPVLLIWGERDTETPLAYMYRYKKLLKNSQHYIIKNGGHYAYLYAPDIFVRKVNEFFG